MSDTFPGAKEALESLRPVLRDIPAAEVSAHRFNAPQAVSNMLKIDGAFSEDKASFAAAFTPAAFDPAAFADLGTRARALWQADVEWRQRVEADAKLPPLLTEAGPLKSKLFRAATYLWAEDPEAGQHVADIRSGQGYLDLADDLMALANLFDARWSEAEGITHVKKDDLGRARTIGAAISAAYGGRNTDENAETLRDLRQRAFHYAYVAALEIRDAAEYVHRKRPERLDAYPSPFHYRRAGRPRTKADDAEAPTPAPARTLEPAEA